MQELFKFFLQFNWIDYIIIFGAVLYMIEGYGAGFVSAMLDIGGFLLSFVIALALYVPLGTFLSRVTHLSAGFANSVAFVIVAIVIELLARLIQSKVDIFIDRIPGGENSPFGKINHALGIIPGLFSGLILLSFFLTIFIVFPFFPPIKNAISNSTLGTVLVEQTQNFEKRILQGFGGKGEHLLTFFTIEPQANSTTKLDFTTDHAVEDSAAEGRMMILINSEREKQGLSPLVADGKLAEVGRDHDSDMLSQGYFSHYSPEGLSPFDRMNAAAIIYSYAGENLAFSPNVDLAMEGLMNSPGHRANILSPNFHKVGIGIMNAGIYGEMFAQEFTD